MEYKYIGKNDKEKEKDMADFNPNDIGIANGRYFALPYDAEEAEIVILPVGWDVTTSYAAGTSEGPEAVKEASLQVDLFDLSYPEAWKVKIGTLDAPAWLEGKNAIYRAKAEQVIEALGEGASQESVQPLCDEINEASAKLNEAVYNAAKEQIEKGKTVALLGGDHSTPLGAIKAAADRYGKIGVLHIDAHADLREAYEGFRYSHASIMFNVLAELGDQVTALTQVGIRDFCSDEYRLMRTDARLFPFTDRYLCESQYTGSTWNDLCDDIIATLPEKVYVSFDIDGLSPEYCPHTGTPVPGGLSFNQADFLLRKLSESGKEIVGFDLNEVSPSGEDEWDANVGARLLFKMCIYSKNSHRKLKKD